MNSITIVYLMEEVLLVCMRFLEAKSVCDYLSAGSTRCPPSVDQYSHGVLRWLRTPEKACGAYGPSNESHRNLKYGLCNFKRYARNDQDHSTNDRQSPEKRRRMTLNSGHV
jgi:hypothetical protein